MRYGDSHCGGGLTIGIRLLALLICGTASAATMGPNSPTTVVNDVSLAGTPWTSPGNAVASDDMYAMAALAMTVSSNYLAATGFGFSIPADAVVTGIQVDVERSTQGSGFGSVVVDRAIRIIKGGVIGVTDRSLGTNWPDADAYATYGGPSDLWGETWTASDINSPTFGAAVALMATSGSGRVDHIRITVSYTFGCPASPAPGCRTAMKSSILLKDKPILNDKDKLIWKWIKGQATSPSDFGAPTSSTDYALCLYAGAVPALIGAANIPAGAAGWSGDPSGFKYDDKTGSQSGIIKGLLKSSTGPKAKEIFKGKGALLPDPLPIMPTDLPVIVQLVNSASAVCWESTFQSTAVKKNDAETFKAKFP
jgi:hypothetical protein